MSSHFNFTQDDLDIIITELEKTDPGIRQRIAEIRANIAEKLQEASTDDFGIPVPAVMEKIIDKFAPAPAFYPIPRTNFEVAPKIDHSGHVWNPVAGNLAGTYQYCVTCAAQGFDERRLNEPAVMDKFTPKYNKVDPKTGAVSTTPSKRCSCGDWAYPSSGTCGPNGCFNCPA